MQPFHGACPPCIHSCVCVSFVVSINLSHYPVSQNYSGFATGSDCFCFASASLRAAMQDAH